MAPVPEFTSVLLYPSADMVPAPALSVMVPDGSNRPLLPLFHIPRNLYVETL